MRQTVSNKITMSKQQSKIFRFKISLLEIEPEIWRVIEVPESYTFWDLHVAIQDAMGWLDYHLHSFDPNSSSRPDNRAIGIPEGPMDSDFIAGWTIPITKHFIGRGDSARYEYDFGDGWIHEIELLAIEPKQSDITYPRCISGERACPPEDCGSIPGYYRLVEILSDPKDPEYQDMIEWLKGHAKNYYPYDPEFFDADSVNFWDPKKRLEMMLGT